MKRLTIWAVTAAMLWAAPASAEVQLSIANGRVTLIATNATVREILAEWSRIGQTRVVNGEKVPGAPVTLELRDIPESQALAIILRSVGGYIAAPREVPLASVSKFDRILVMPTVAPVRTATTSAPPPAVFAPPSAPTFNQPPAAADNPDAGRINELRNELLNRTQQTFEQLNNANTAQPATAPAPVMSQPTQQPAAPAAPAAGSRRPGTIAPAPQQQPQSNPDR